LEIVMLRVHEVTTAYQGLVAISAVSIEVQKGEIVCVAGANGAGKSTLLKSIAGAERPRAVVPAIVREARARGLDETRLYEVMTMRMGLGGTRRLADLLVDGEDEAALAGIRSSSPRQ